MSEEGGEGAAGTRKRRSARILELEGEKEKKKKNNDNKDHGEEKPKPKTKPKSKSKVEDPQHSQQDDHEEEHEEGDEEQSPGTTEAAAEGPTVAGEVLEDVAVTFVVSPSQQVPLLILPLAFIFLLFPSLTK